MQQIPWRPFGGGMVMISPRTSSCCVPSDGSGNCMNSSAVSSFFRVAVDMAPPGSSCVPIISQSSDLDPGPLLRRLQHRVADIGRPQRVAEIRHGRLAAVESVDEVGDLVDKAVLVADL